MPQRHTARHIALVACTAIVTVVATASGAGAASGLRRGTVPSLTLTQAGAVSGNWAGYVASPPTGQGVTAVSGQWTVPDAGSTIPGVSSTWVGIGGNGTSDLIQAGTQASASPYSNIFQGGAYSAWYEMLPAAPVYLTGCAGDPACTVTVGDPITTSITNVGANSWSLVMTDGTRWKYTGILTYQSAQASAEWIHEAPSALGAVPIPVGGFVTATFDANNTFTVGNGSAQTIAAGHASPYEALPVETTTSALDGDGDGFNVCTYALTCAAPAS